MGATLADGGVNPLTRRASGPPSNTCRYTLAVMATAGLYETSGDWLYDVGLPGKSGIGGGIVTVALRARVGWGHSRPRLHQLPGTVSGANSPPGSCRGGSGFNVFLSQPVTG